MSVTTDGRFRNGWTSCLRLRTYPLQVRGKQNRVMAMITYNLPTSPMRPQALTMNMTFPRTAVLHPGPLIVVPHCSNQMFIRHPPISHHDMYLGGHEGQLKTFMIVPTDPNQGGAWCRSRQLLLITSLML
jgi:hypothetical protein